MVSGRVEQRPGRALDNWLRAARDAAKHAKDLRTPFRALSKRWSEEERRIFTSQGHPGRPWAPLKQSTLEERMRKGWGLRPILGRTGDLGASLINPAHPQAIETIARDRYERGSSVGYAAAHETGTRYMVARPVLPAATRILEAGADLVADWLIKPFEETPR